MPKRWYERREPIHNWQQIQPLLKDTAQINYEVIRPPPMIAILSVSVILASISTGISLHNWSCGSPAKLSGL